MVAAQPVVVPEPLDINSIVKHPVGFVGVALTKPGLFAAPPPENVPKGLAAVLSPS